jgi:elongation factor G
MAHEIDYTYKKLLTGGGEFAKVRLRITLAASGSGVSFMNSAVNNVPAEFVPGVEKGVRDVAGTRDLIIELVDGAYHDIDSSVLTFEVAARSAMTKALADMGI